MIACGTGLLDGIADEMQPELIPHLLGILALLAQDGEACKQLCSRQGSYGEATQMDIDSEGQHAGSESWDGRYCFLLIQQQKSVV